MKVRTRKCDVVAMLAVGASLGCSVETGEPVEVETVEQEVVGGSQEDGYPSGGYLVRGAPGFDPTTPVCSAVQIGPNTVATAAHCFVNWNTTPPTIVAGSFSWGFGRGEVTNAERYTATSVEIHPQYDPAGTIRFANDLAIVHFDSAIGGGTWAEVVDAAAGSNCGTSSASALHTYVGYGRDTTGGSGIPADVPNDRKSATQCIANVDMITLDVTGVDGGLCWGDSGGPLFDTGAERVSGVLSDFDTVFSCQVANDMIFTRLASYKDFICDGSIYIGDGAFCERSFSAEMSVIL